MSDTLEKLDKLLIGDPATDLKEEQINKPDQPPTDPQKNTPDEPPTEDPPEKETPDAEDTPPADPPKKNEFIEKINELLGTEYDSEDSFSLLKDDISKLPQYKEAEQSVSKISELETEIEKYKVLNKELEDLYDPKKIFVSDAEATRQQLLRKYPDYDPSVITKVLNADLDNLSPQKAILLKTLLEDGDIYSSEQDVNALFEDEHGFNLNTEISELDEVHRLKVMKLAKEAKKLFTGLKEGSDNEENKSILDKINDNKTAQQESLRQLKEGWDEKLQGLPKDIKDLKFTMKDESGEDYEFKYQLGKEFRDSVQSNLESISKGLANEGRELTDESKQRLTLELKDHFIKTNIDKMMQSAVSDGIARYIEALEKDKANPKPPKQDTPPVPQTTEDQDKAKSEQEILDDLRGNSGMF